MKRGYVVEAQTAPLRTLDENTLDAFAAALFGDRHLAGPAPAANTLTRVLSVRTSIDAATPEDALAAAAARIRLALRRAGAGDIDLTELSVLLELPEDEHASSRDDLVGTPDVADRLGISRQRVAQLVEQTGRFPTPVATVRGTHVWRWGDIADWIAAGQRDMRRRPESKTVELMAALKRSVERARDSEPRVARRHTRAKSA